jgi:hypothetical protein
MINESEVNAGQKTVAFEDHNDRDSWLDSWKEIAAYLNRNVRTVQRWEKIEGLPIHRHVHERGSSVSACKREIDRWQKRRLHVSDEIPAQQRELELLIERLRTVLLMERMREALAILLDTDGTENLFASPRQDLSVAAESCLRVD